MKFSAFIATSIDGYIARKNGDIDWLTLNESSPNEDYGYNEFISKIDVIVMGRNTFEKVKGFENWPYKIKVIVLSSKNIDIPSSLTQFIELFSGSIDDLVQHLNKNSYKSVYVDGGKLIQSFINKQILNSLIQTRIPILLGDGIPLFGYIKKDVHLKHVFTKSFKNGLTQSSYKFNY